LGAVRLDWHLGADNRVGLPDPQSRGCAARKAAVVPARLRRARYRTKPERNPMKRSFLLMPLIALAVIALAACGASANRPPGPSLGSGTHTQQSASLGSLAAARAAVTCVRQHGMPGVPDPVVGANGQVSVPGYATTADLTPSARSACAAQIR